MLNCVAFTLSNKHEKYFNHLNTLIIPSIDNSPRIIDNSNLSDKVTHCTTSDMTANPAYGTTSGIMTNLSSTTIAKIGAAQNEESIVMHKNPTYATAAETMSSMERDN